MPREHILRQLADARNFSDGAWGSHATVTLSDGSSHLVRVEGVYPTLLLVKTLDNGETVPIEDVVEVAYEDVNGH